MRTQHTSFGFRPRGFLVGTIIPWSGLYTIKCIDAICCIKLIAINDTVWHH